MDHNFEIKMKKILILAFNALFCTLSFAQESASSLYVLTMPTSSHVAALGGENTSVIDTQPGIVVHNPALLANMDTNVVGFEFMTYFSGTNWMGAQYSRAFGDRHTGAVFANYMGYGSMDETDEMGHVIGSFSPKDMIFGVGYSYLLNDKWAGGADIKMAYSKIAEYSSLALALDLGINYYDAEKKISTSLVMRNIGAQVKTFDGVVERVPFNLEGGATFGLAHLPVEFNVTLQDLTRWKRKDYYSPDANPIKVTRLLLNHLVVGLEIKPTNYMYLAAGYNFRRAYELKAAGSSHMAGLTAGMGINVRNFKLGLTWAKYHKSTNSIMGNVAYAF